MDDAMSLTTLNRTTNTNYESRSRYDSDGFSFVYSCPFECIPWAQWIRAPVQVTDISFAEEEKNHWQSETQQLIHVYDPDVCRLFTTITSVLVWRINIISNIALLYLRALSKFQEKLLNSNDNAETEGRRGRNWWAKQDKKESVIAVLVF